jgi:HAD-superfamily phosphatase, subfamily IIIC
MDLKKIKLVIWDLDNTFWSGIVSEGEIKSIPQNIELIKNLTDSGIINSICSKNTLEIAIEKLKELGVADYFVFPSIDWTSKGQRIHNLIEAMSLRAENVLFIDDEVTNLEEARYYSPEIMVSTPDGIQELFEFAVALEKSDLSHTRLQQYKLLEKKGIEQRKYDNNEDFLYASNVKATISDDCIPELARIHDLLTRSNQLNYTKKRISKEELKMLLESKTAQCAYISVSDKFGDYGIVGFYAMVGNRLDHFLFSCRIKGLGVEQFVYSKLNFPQLEIVGEVASKVEKTNPPLWINNSETAENVNEAVSDVTNNIPKTARFLFKSACDFSQAVGYIKNADLFHCEFDYVNVKRGNVITGHNHSVHIAALKEFSKSQKQEILDDCIFYDGGMFRGSIFNKKYDIVFLSTFPEAYAGIYKKKNSNIQVTAGSYLFPLTDETKWPGLIAGSLYSSSNKFTLDYLKEFSEKYEFMGKTTTADYRERINKILNDLDKHTKLCLILGVEFPCEKNSNPFFENRHVAHAQLNREVREFAQNNPRLILLDLNQIVKNQNDFGNNINEFSSRVNYDLSKKIISIIEKSVDTKMENYSSLLVFVNIFLKRTRQFAKQFIPRDNGLYLNLQNVYYKLSRKK